MHLRLPAAFVALVVLAACGSSHPVNGVTEAQVACTACHGDPARPGAALNQAAPPASPTGGGNGGAHLAHLDRGVACTACHVVPTSPGHKNGVVEVTFSGAAVARGAAPTYSAADGTCSNVYCHGAKLAAGGIGANPVWSGGRLACNACHGFPPPAPHTTSTACSVCHPGTVKADGTVNDAGGLHANGTVEAAGGHAAGWSNPDQHGPAAMAGLSACRSCHGQNLDGVGGTASSCAACHDRAGYASWQSNCTFCHGAKTANYVAGSVAAAAPPRGTQGETATTTLAVGAHQKHLAGATLGPAVACTECHAMPTDLSHLDGVAAVAFGPGAKRGGATPGWSAGRCSNVYCHGGTLAGGSNNAPTWIAGATQTTCGTCHGVPPPAPHTTSTACGTCHTGYTSTTVNAALHMNGTVDAASGHAAGWAAKEQHGYAANRNGLPSCTGCHGADFNGGTTGASCNACHASAGFATWQTNCTFCHGTRVQAYTAANLASAAPPVGTEGEYATTTRAVGAHQKHLAGGTLGPAVACATCHMVPADLAHVNGSATVTLTGPAAQGGVTPSWNATAGTCASYCHGASLGGGTRTAPSWTAGASETACGSCHGIPPPAPHSTSTTCETCHTGYTSTSVNKPLHMNGTVDATSPHPTGWGNKDQHGYSVNRSGLTSCKSCHGQNLDGVGGSAQSCTACHGTKGFAGWATSCTFCHGDRTSGRASPPVDTQGLNLKTNVSVGVHDSHMGTTWMATPACTACHPDRTGSNVITDAAHIDGNGVAEVAFGAVAKLSSSAATYTRTSATAASCNSVYCHSNGAPTNGTKTYVQMSWTSTTAVTCTSCHGSPPSTGKHLKHVGEADCGGCHPGGYSSGPGGTGTVNQATHIDGTKQVGGTGTGWNATTRSCSNSCHGSKTWPSP
jgi:predicted CxxxxCH...CXXCH cytochrome family protein